MKSRYLFKAKDEGGFWQTGYLLPPREMMYACDYKPAQILVEVPFQKTAGGDSMGENSIHYIDEETICQSTGLKDSQGNLIFEGDILYNEEYYKIRINDDELVEKYHNHTIEIMWDKGSFKKRTIKEKNYHYGELPGSLESINETTHYNIIGNIHNKEAK